MSCFLSDPLHFVSFVTSCLNALKVLKTVLYMFYYYYCSLFRITKRAGEKEGSGLMKANAWHHRADAISSFVALIGVGKDCLL